MSKQNGKKNIVICGAYGFGNVGDEAILESIIASLSMSYPNCNITVLSRNPEEDAKREGVTRAVHSLSLFDVISALKDASLFVSGGGSLIQDVTSTRSLMYYLYTIKLAKKYGCKVMMYGSGIGPIIHKENRGKTAAILNNCVDVIALRDKKSERELEILGVNKPEILVTADSAVSHRVADDAAVDAQMKKLGLSEDEKFIVIALRKWKNFESKIEDFAKAADYAYEKYGLKPLFFPIDHAGDREAESLVAEKMKAPYAIVEDSLPADIALGIIKKASAVLSVRLHGLIFAASVGTPMAAVSYDPKVSSFMEYIGVDNCIEFEDACCEKLTSLIDKSLSLSPEKLAFESDKLKKLEKNNIEKAEKLLGKEDGLTKLAFFESDFRVGGIQKSLLNILTNLDYSKYSADVYYYDSEFFYEKPENPNLRFIELKPYPYWCRFVFFGLLKTFAKQNLSDKEYDVAIDFNSYQNDCAVGAATVKAKKRVMWIHNDVEIKLANEPKYKILKFFFSGKYKYFDAFAAVSPGIVDSFRRSTGTDKPIVVIQNYINTDEIIEKSKLEPAVTADFDGYKLCSVGRLCHQKGYDILLDLYAKVIEQRKDMHLYLIGDGPDKEKLMAQAESLGISDYLTFTGNQTNPFAVMNQMDGFVLTSRYEGQGMVILEAKTLGLDLFISKNLEKYNPGIEGKDDIVSALACAKPVEKKTDLLSDYNNNIAKGFDSLFEVHA